MDNNNFDGKITDILSSLKDKIEEATSKNGLVTVFYNGLGEYKRVLINKELDEIDKDILEKEIKQIFEDIKNSVSSMLADEIARNIEESKEEENNNVS